MEEIWKSIIGYNDLYFISNRGRVYSKKVRNGNILKNTINTGGYYEVSLSKGKINKKHYNIHRLVAIYFIDNPLNLKEVNHLDGNKLNNNDWNLEWASASGNQLHAVFNNLRPNATKLNMQQVIEIREKSLNISQKELAKEYNITIANVKSI